MKYANLRAVVHDTEKIMLGKKQRQILDFLSDRLQPNGVCPSLQEIAAAVGLGGPSTVNYHLKKLESQGFITRPYGQPRSIQLSSPDAEPAQPIHASHLNIRHLGDRINIDGWRILLGVGRIEHQAGSLVSIHTASPTGQPEPFAHILHPDAPIQYEPKGAA